MTLTPWEEREVLQDIIDGLGAAIESNDDWSVKQLDPIKFNKLMFLAIDEFELPITYRWYRYGFDVTHIGKNLDDLEPKALAELASPEEPRVVKSWESPPYEYPSPEEVKMFFLDRAPDLNRLFNNDTRDYIRQFYSDYAPERYEDLYVKCALFQKAIDNVGHGEDPGNELYENYSMLKERFGELHKEIVTHSHLQDSATGFRDYGELLKDIFASVHSRGGSLSYKEQEVLRDAVRFFYEEAWRFVTLEIAEDDNIGGDNKRELLESTIANVKELKENFSSQVLALRDRCIRSGLVSEEFDMYEGQKERLELAYSRKADEDEQTVREWKNTTTEANDLL